MGYGIASDNRVAERPLGIVTENSATFPEQVTFDAQTGEVTARSMASARAERWALKSVVNRLLSGDRVSKCMVLRAPVPGQGLAPIEVHKGHTHGKAFYHGLMSCGLPWVCPVCAAKIAERRRVELKDAVKNALNLGLGVHFVTLTVPHGIGDDLHDTLSRLSVALKSMSCDGTFRRRKKQCEVEIVGFIRAQEVTYGQNGWHPHYHLLVFTKESTCGSSVIQYLYSGAWKRACVKAGLPEPHPEHGCTVQDGRFAALYVSKWGIEDEMTKANAKRGKRHGLSPWGLLRAVLDGNAPEIAPEPAAALFRLYAHAFKGRRQLHWSVGLRDKLLPEQAELSDQQIVERPEDERASLLAELTPEQWTRIRRVHGQAAVLEAAERGPEAFAFALSALAGPDATVMTFTDSPPDAAPPMPQARGRGDGGERSFCPVCFLPLAAGHCVRCSSPPGRVRSLVPLDFCLAYIFGSGGVRRSGAEERGSD